MKTQRRTKRGAAIGSAVALLLISVLLAPSPALAKENWIQDPNSKLIPTGVEPAASGRTHASGEWSDLMLPWGFYFDGEVTGSCRGLTPSTTYTITVTEHGALAGTVSAVASETGDFTFACGVWSEVPYPDWNIFSVQVANDAGQIVLVGAFHIQWHHY